MKAIILAAGVGKRLSVVTRHKPKTLIEFGGQTLLARSLDALARVGIVEVVIVVGYKQELIREEAASHQKGRDLRFVVNQEYQRGSIGSLWAVRHECDKDLVVMDADVLFHPDMLVHLVTSAHGNALLMDETVTQQSEECMVVVRNGRVVALTKHLPEEFDLAGEGVGFLKVQGADTPLLVESLEGFVQQGCLDMEYEDALENFFQRVQVGYEKIGGIPWIEIDFPEDIDRANREIWPKLPSI